MNIVSLIAIITVAWSAIGIHAEQNAVTPGGVYRITPVRPIAQILSEDEHATPPHETGKKTPNLVELVRLDPSIHLDIRYAGTNNFLSTPVYPEARAFLQQPAAEALVRAGTKVHARGFGLLIHDAYRPWYITKVFWDATPPDQHIFVANPATGSRHNRGCAVDLSLYDRASGKEAEMPSVYDEMTRRAYADYPGGTAEQRQRRQILRDAMTSEGFAVNRTEWWHFDFRGCDDYPIMNVPFAQIRSK